MRGGRTTTTSIIVSTNSFVDDVERQIQIYENTSYELPEDNNPLLFWRDQQRILPMLSKIAKSIFVIQASSAESRTALFNGQINCQRRKISTGT